MLHPVSKDEAQKIILKNTPAFFLQSWEVVKGLIIPGILRPDNQIKHLGIPESLIGKTVIDVGCADGYFSFEAEQREAKRVLATDIIALPGFKTVNEILRPENVNYLQIGAYNLEPEKIGTFDVTFFFGVIYHLKHPLYALEKLSQITNEMIIVESHIIMENSNEKNTIPIARFWPGSLLNNDPTNWWSFNMQCLHDMLKTVGFQKVEKHRVYGKNQCGARGVVIGYK